MSAVLIPVAALLAGSAWHLGALHPVEQALVLVLAFGPFLLLGVVVALRRREERRTDHRTDHGADHRADHRDR